MIKKYIEKYKNIPIQVKASLAFLICGILQNGLNIITLPIFTRILSTEQYGLSSTYFAWNDLIVVICTLRLSYGVFDKGMIKYNNERDKFQSSLLGLTTTISVFMLVIFLIFHTYIEKMLGLSFILCFSLFASQIFAPGLLFWTVRNKYEYKYKEFTIVTIATSVGCTLFNLASVLLIKYDRGITKILSYQVVWALVGLIFCIVIFVKGKTFFNKKIWKYALGFNLPLIPYFLSTLLLDKADRIMIGYFWGNSDVALYSVSYNLGRLMVLVTSSLEATFTPWFYQKIKEKNYENTKKITFMIMLCFLVLTTAFMLFAPELITIFADKRYKEAVYIIPPVIASYFFVMLYAIVSKLEFYYEKTKTIAIVTVLAALINVGLNYIMIPKFGYIAAGYTTLVSYIVMAIVHMLVSYKIAKKENISNKVFSWGIFIFMSLIMLSITIFVNITYTTVLLRYGIILLIVLIAIIYRKQLIKSYKLLKGKN